MTPLAAEPPNYRKQWLPWALQGAKHIDNTAFSSCLVLGEESTSQGVQNKTSRWLRHEQDLPRREECPGRHYHYHPSQLVCFLLHNPPWVSTPKTHPGLVPQNNAGCPHGGCEIVWAGVGMRPRRNRKALMRAAELRRQGNKRRRGKGPVTEGVPAAAR